MDTRFNRGFDYFLRFPICTLEDNRFVICTSQRRWEHFVDRFFCKLDRFQISGRQGLQGEHFFVIGRLVELALIGENHNLAEFLK